MEQNETQTTVNVRDNPHWRRRDLYYADETDCVSQLLCFTLLQFSYSRVKDLNHPVSKLLFTKTITNNMAASLRALQRSRLIQDFLRRNSQENQFQLTWSRNLALTRRLQQEDAPAEDDTNTSPKRLIVDVQTSIRYLDSKAFQEGYGDKPVWFHYRRNFKGQIPPKTRKSCIRNGEISTSSPCPVCRDEYLVLDSKNTKLLEQFISPYSGEILDSKQTGLCQQQQKTLVLEVMRAQDEGGLEKQLPFRTYNYEDYKS
ncbi:28S ribosomal protein s18b, mitochondrial [Plakobranchus ocellatus]|uniref:Small ribosomal subunit protein mS40 n=1 Tax=Plakobranchus ocellatus TaxID=259542 RepID=A0AAV4DNH5_9GAST|nr:28S ribosomal protein s18b, mitochondrial [Plakobranchus ocellatus]